MSLRYYRLLNQVNCSNILDYLSLHNDPFFKEMLIQACIKQNKPDILNTISITKEDIPYHLCSECDNIETLKIIAPHITLDDNFIDMLIANDNIEALDFFSIDPISRIATVEEEVPYKIVERLLKTNSLRKDDIFMQSILTNNYETFKLLVDQVDSMKILWRNVISSNDSRIVDMCMEKFKMPSIFPIELIKTAIQEGHMNFLQKVCSNMYTLNPSVLSSLISKRRIDDAMVIYQIYNFSDYLDDDYYITNEEGYVFYKDFKGFDVEYCILDLIENKEHQLLDKIADENIIDPNEQYLFKALTGDCKYTLFVVLNRYVSRLDIQESVDELDLFKINNRKCFILYYRICNYINIKIPNLYNYAIKFDSVELLKACDYISKYVLKDSIINCCPRIYNYVYSADFIISSVMLHASYPVLALSDNIDFLYLIICRYGVPKDYVNDTGKIGSMRLLEENRDY